MKQIVLKFFFFIFGKSFLISTNMFIKMLYWLYFGYVVLYVVLVIFCTFYIIFGRNSSSSWKFFFLSLGKDSFLSSFSLQICWLYFVQRSIERRNEKYLGRIRRKSFKFLNEIFSITFYIIFVRNSSS